MIHLEKRKNAGSRRKGNDRRAKENPITHEDRRKDKRRLNEDRRTGENHRHT